MCNRIINLPNIFLTNPSGWDAGLYLSPIADSSFSPRQQIELQIGGRRSIFDNGILWKRKR